METEPKASTRLLTPDGAKVKELKMGLEQKVVIVNVDMKIMDMATFMVKWAIATIPAAIMLLAIFLVFGGAITAIVRS